MEYRQTTGFHRQTDHFTGNQSYLKFPASLRKAVSMSKLTFDKIGGVGSSPFQKDPGIRQPYSPFEMKFFVICIPNITAFVEHNVAIDDGNFPLKSKEQRSWWHVLSADTGNG